MSACQKQPDNPPRHLQSLTCGAQAVLQALLLLVYFMVMLTSSDLSGGIWLQRIFRKLVLCKILILRNSWLILGRI
ncbi:Uncharacterized protein APZ42_014573 [Daphnia magna]|uniref:Uncharacterized protein n=1 Tax=Daphnia magna TaxID=35525 RepID=A0A162PQG8_9CRUS|nr:Uncharacterized protein APZ42_014573 [Daphnia magna]